MQKKGQREKPETHAGTTACKPATWRRQRKTARTAAQNGRPCAGAAPEAARGRHAARAAASAKAGKESTTYVKDTGKGVSHTHIFFVTLQAKPAHGRQPARATLQSMTNFPNKPSIMTKTIIALALAALTATAAEAKKQQESTGYPITQVPFTSVKISQGTFWGQRIKAARDVTIPLALQQVRERGPLRELRQGRPPLGRVRRKLVHGLPL